MQLRIERLATPCFTASGGGKRRVGFGGLDPHLGGGLERSPSELAEHIPAAFLRIVDQMPVAGGVHRLDDLLHRLLKSRPHSVLELDLIDLLEPIHGCPFPATPCR
ncbi:MAG TPA: hypothetical protein PKB10_01050 [Tepidisphaeraceae bacterium]|nr:hypothetical protein [Tepidisphaeraceae bacterium]